MKVTLETRIRLVSQKPGDTSSMYATREEDFEYVVADPNQISPHEVQERLIASALKHPDLAAEGYRREHVAVLEFEISSKP